MMRRILTLVGAIATLAAGVTAAVAVGAGSSAPDPSTGTTTAAGGEATTTTASDSSTGTTTAVAPAATTATAPDNLTGTTTAAAGEATTTTASSNVWVCHHTGSWKHPYHLIHISAHALPAHMRHGDVTLGVDSSCPTTQPAGTKTHGRGNKQSNNAKTKDDSPGKGDDKTETNDD